MLYLLVVLENMKKKKRIKGYNSYIRFQGYGGGEAFKGLSTDSG